MDKFKLSGLVAVGTGAGQEMGDILILKLTRYDKWIKRVKCYIRDFSRIYDQYDNLKMRYYGTLILSRKNDALPLGQGHHELGYSSG